VGDSKHAGATLQTADSQCALSIGASDGVAAGWECGPPDCEIERDVGYDPTGDLGLAGGRQRDDETRHDDKSQELLFHVNSL
jgi:hypothetical protein